ncbi:MAG: hypothetical protein P8J24_10115, partial [Arenicellales bacterium]|nr:hypothetical protein [Arenicellales bacterium]
FDLSFMSRARLSGVDAQQLVNNFVSRDVSDMPENRVTYCVRLDHQGYVTSDLTVWKLESDGYEVMSGNADGIAALMSQQSPDCRIDDLSDSHSVFAVQGPESLLRLARLDDQKLMRGVAIPQLGQTPRGVPDQKGDHQSIGREQKVDRHPGWGKMWALESAFQAR